MMSADATMGCGNAGTRECGNSKATRSVRLPALSPSGFPAFRQREKGTVPTTHPSPPVQSLFSPFGLPAFPPSSLPAPRRAARRGFTLIELIVVIAIIGILAAVAIPAMRQAPKRAREAALKENLFTIRSCIDQYYADFQKYPGSLDELVSKGYLRRVPIDPVTGQVDWVTEEGEMPQGEFGEFSDFAEPGIVDIRSASSESSLDGTPYSEW